MWSVTDNAQSVELSEETAAGLSQPVSGEGGFQSLVRALQSRLSGRFLEVDDDTREQIEHYAYDYGSGGWQDLLRQLLEEIERQSGSTEGGHHSSPVEAP